MAFLHFLIVLFVDLMMDLLAILMALKILCVRIRPFRVCFGAFFAAFFAAGARMGHVSEAWTALLWIPMSMVLIRICGGKKGFLAALRGSMTLLSCFGFLGGMVLALNGAIGSLAASYAISMVAAAAFFVAAIRETKAVRDVRCVRVECVIKERQLAFDAIVDSGNSLRDYLTYRPVIVAGDGIAKRFSDEILRMRPIFADTAGGRQMMQLLIPKETALLLDGRRIMVDAAIAFSPGLGETAMALVPASLLDHEE